MVGEGLGGWGRVGGLGGWGGVSVGAGRGGREGGGGVDGKEVGVGRGERGSEAQQNGRSLLNRGIQST